MRQSPTATAGCVSRFARMPPDVDNQLAKVVNGDLEAYREVIAEHQRTAWNVLSVLLYDRPTTERLVAEVFITVYQALPRFDPKQQALKDLVRAAARHKVREQLAAQADGERLAAYREHVAACFTDDASAINYQRDLIDRFRRCTTSLPDAMSRMMQMRYHQSQDWTTIGKATRRPVTSVRKQLHRAFGAIATCMTRAPSE